MATRVFELARELDVRSKDVLEKCRAEGIDVKNHMTSLSAGLEETIRDWFSDVTDLSTQHTAVETANRVDLEKARKKAKTARRRMTAKQKAEEAAAAKLGDAETQAPLEPATEVVEPPAAPEVYRRLVSTFGWNVRRHAVPNRLMLQTARLAPTNTSSATKYSPICE